MRKFFLLWITLLICELASEIVSFSVGIQVFQVSGALSDLSLFYLSTTVPGLVLSPIAGRWVDRFPLWRVLVFCSLVNIALGFLIILQQSKGLASHGLLFCIYGMRSVLLSIQAISMIKAVPMLVTQADLHRANSLLNLQRTLPRLLSGVMGGLLIELNPNSWLIYFNIIPYFLPLFALVKIANHPLINQAIQREVKGTFKNGFLLYKETLSKYSLLPLLVFLMLGSSALAFFGTLLTPLILQKAGPMVLGGISGVAGGGALIGSIVANLLTNRSQLTYRMIGVTNLCQGLCLLSASVLNTPLSICVIYSSFVCLDVLGKAFNYSIWQKRVPREIQGRIFGVNRFLVMSVSSFSIFICGKIVDGLKNYNFQNYIGSIFEKSETLMVVITSLLILIGLTQFTASLIFKNKLRDLVESYE